MAQRIVRVPGEGDCFFHVVAYFLGEASDDVDAALDVRRNLAAEAARRLFLPPYNNLAQLTPLVWSSTDLGDLNGVVNAATVDAANLQGLYFGGPHLDNGNGGACPLAAFVVWMQYNVAEIDQLRKGHVPDWLGAGGFANYTIWGDAAFTADLVVSHYEMAVDFYTNVSLPQLTENALDTVNVYVNGGNHFDAAIFEEDEHGAAGLDEGEPDDDVPAPHIGNLTLEIHHLDIGQGDATLIVVRDRRRIMQTVLIDAADSGEAPLIDEYMHSLGIVNLDILAITHYDKDHFRGALALLNNSTICQNTCVFDRGEPEDADHLTSFNLSLAAADLEEDRLFGDDLAALKALLAGPSAKRRVCARKPANWMVGQKLINIGADGEPPLLTLTCVAANGHVLGGKFVPPLHSDRENARSMCFLLQFGSFAYYLGGDAPGVPANDLEGAVGAAIVKHFELDHVCGMKVSHHGSHHSTTPEFIELLDPTSAFVSCGIHDKFLHPRQEPIDALVGGERMQNFYLTRCVYRRNHITPHGRIQVGPARVAGDESTLGTIVLRIEHSMIHDHIFYVGYWDREMARWRVQRHCCLSSAIAEEITFKQEQPDDLVISACPRTQPGEYIEQKVLLEDAIERQRAARDEEIVRATARRDRIAVRGTLDGGEPKEKKEPKTIETEEMLMQLDEELDQEIEDDDRRADEEDSDFDE